MAAITRGKRLVLLSLGLEKWKLDRPTDDNEGKNNLKILDVDLTARLNVSGHCSGKLDLVRKRVRERLV